MIKTVKTQLSILHLRVGTCCLRLVLNALIVGESVTTAGRRFQSWVVLGKKESLIARQWVGLQTL